MHWSQTTLARAASLASLSDAVMQFGMVLLLLAVGIAGVVIWLTLRRWGPALHQLSAIVDREMHDAERSAEGLQQNAQAQMKRVYRQAASVRSALDGVKSLHTLTVDLEQRADDLRQLAHHVAAESSAHGPAADDFTHYAIASADQLAETAERARHTYRKLLTSVNQLVTDGDSLREGEEMERQARELTGAVERVRLAVHDRRVLAPNASAKPGAGRNGKGHLDDTRRPATRDQWPERAHGREALFDPVERPARGRRPEPATPEARSQPGAGRPTRNRASSRDAYDGSPPAIEHEWEDRGHHSARPTRSRERDPEHWRDDADRPDEPPRRRPTHRRSPANDERDWQR